MSPQEQCEKLEAAVGEAGKQVAAYAAKSIMEVCPGFPLRAYNEIWEGYAEHLMMELSDTLRIWGLDQKYIAYFQDIALESCEVEFDRLMEGWLSDGGRA